MRSSLFDHTMTLNLTSEMVAQIDDGLARLGNDDVTTRSAFIRGAVRYALYSMDQPEDEDGG